jgi:hypothetical protein
MNKAQALCVSLIVGSISLAGCQAKLSGELAVNGQTFMPTSCRSGEAASFTGVDLIAANGSIVRVVQTPMNIPQVLYMQSEGAQAVPVGACGTLTLRRTNTRINDIYNVEGSVSLQCAGAMTVSGSVRFANCH